MTVIGYVLLLLVAIAYVIAMVVGMITALPWGIVGLLGLLGIGVLFIKVLQERLANQEDAYYSKHIKK